MSDKLLLLLVVSVFNKRFLLPTLSLIHTIWLDWLHFNLHWHSLHVKRRNLVSSSDGKVEHLTSFPWLHGLSHNKVRLFCSAVTTLLCLSCLEGITSLINPSKQFLSSQSEFALLYCHCILFSICLVAFNFSLYLCLLFEVNLLVVSRGSKQLNHSIDVLA